MATSLSQYALVAAIDFGTAYSGYAFSYYEEYKRDPSKIYTNNWKGSSGLLSTKAPTCALFDSNKTFHSFGYEAEDKYVALSEKGEEKVWYYFQRFKMTLYNQKNLKENFQLETDDGKKLPAMTVFSSCIKYLVDDLLKICQDNNSGLELTDICWVLTVPAIWNDAAKSFMRKAAETAGILSHQILIALEPEAASVYCKSLPMRMLAGSENGSGPLQPGDKYLILDAGGGTIDITVHKVHHDGSLRELHAASGGDWGGMKVDKAFYDLLVNIVGKAVMVKVERNDKSDKLELLREFEVKKRKFVPGMTDHMSLRVPVAFSKTYKKERGRAVNDAIAENKAYKDRVSWVRDKMKLEADIAKGFFSASCEQIGKHLEKIFRCPAIKDVSNILMVGGYSESPILQDFIRTKFGEKKVIIPLEPSLAVLKGAVKFGYNPHVIAERICKFTYGLSMSVPFIHGVHPRDKIYITDQGTENCIGVFEKFAEIGEPIKTCEPQYETARVPADRKQKQIAISVYASVEVDPKYITDRYCMYVGTIKVPLTETEGLDRRVRLKIYISGTEIEVAAEEENTGARMQAELKFLG